MKHLSPKMYDEFALKPKRAIFYHLGGRGGLIFSSELFKMVAHVKNPQVIVSLLS